MNNKMETTELIEKYLEGSLNSEERKAVEDKANTDEEFRKLIQLHREVDESLSDEDFFDLHKKLELISAGFNNAKTKSRLNYALRIAALFILLAGSAALLRYVLPAKSIEQRLYNQYYTTYEADPVMRSDQASGTFSEAIRQYSEKNYSKALQMLSSIVEADPNNFLALYFMGVTYMELNDPQNAALSFAAIPNNWQSPYMEHRNWYYALSLLKLEKTRDALRLFQIISEDGGYYSADASRILSKLS